MADTKISDATAKSTVNGEEVFPIVDLRESLTTNQNKKMTTDTILASVLTYENEVLIFEDDALYYG